MNHRNVLLGVLMLVTLGMRPGRAQETRMFRYLGDQNLQYRVYPGEKVAPATTKGVQLVQLGSNSNDNPAGGTFLDYYVTLEFSYSTKVRSVVVEDVTDAKPMVVLKNEPASAKVRKLRCEGDRFAATQTTMPWLWEEGDAWRVYRVTIETDGKGTMVLLQPMRIDQVHKRMMRASMDELRKAYGPKINPNRERFMRSAAPFVRGAISYMSMELVDPPTNAVIKQAIKDLKHARGQKAPYVVASLKREWAYDLVIRMLEGSSKRTLTKARLVVIAPDIDAGHYEQLAKKHGIDIKVGILGD